MITKRNRLFLALLSATLLAAVSEARPVRVGMFRGIGGAGVFWHTNIHTASTVMAEILANPATAGLGDSLVVPKDGFIFYSMPVAPNNGGTGECAGNGCGPTAEQLAAIVGSLDTLDVLILNSTTSIGSRIVDTAQRRAFERFWSKKGFVSVHATTDSYGLWPGLDSVNGARFRGVPAEQNGAVRIDTVFAAGAHSRFLNRGLFPNAPDTNFFEEWFYFNESGAAIRARAHLKPTLRLDEPSLLSPGSQAAMGDHPMSWYREFPTGGRTFYTALGHRSQVWQGTRLFRRQIYNAVLWAARVDSNGVASLREGAASRTGPAALEARPVPGGLRLRFPDDGARTVELRGLDGRLAARATLRGEGVLAAPRAGVYLLTVGSQNGLDGHRRILVP